MMPLIIFIVSGMAAISAIAAMFMTLLMSYFGLNDRYLTVVWMSLFIIILAAAWAALEVVLDEEGE